MAQCIRLNMECATLCYAAAQLMSLGSEQARSICRICADLCDACAEACTRHIHMKHCQECAEACRACSEACRAMM